MAGKKGPGKPPAGAPKARKPSGSRKGSSSKRGAGGLLTIIAAAVVTIVIGIVLLSLFGDRILKQKAPSEKITADQKDVVLYMSDEEGLGLKPFNRKITRGPLESEVKAALEAIIKDRDHSPMPEGTIVRGLSIKDGIAFVDLSREVITNHPGGSTGEIMTIYSIVDSVTLNFPEIKKVQILVEGKREKTLKGHIDISRPLGPDRKMLKS